MLLVMIPVNNKGISTLLINKMIRTLNLKETQSPHPPQGSRNAAPQHTVLGFLHLLLWLSRFACLFWAVLRAPAHDHVQRKVTVLKIARVAGSLLSNAGG